jgi:hypothetical protein
MAVGHCRHMPRMCPHIVTLARSMRQGSRCASALAHGVGRQCLACLGYLVEGPTSTPMVSRLSRVVATDAVRGKRHPNATAPSHRSLRVSASTASRTITSLLNVTLHPAASATGAPAIGPGRASECNRRRASLHPRWHAAPAGVHLGDVAPLARGVPARRQNVAPRKARRRQSFHLVVSSGQPRRHCHRNSTTIAACSYPHLWVTLITIPRSRSSLSRGTWTSSLLVQTSLLFLSHLLAETSQPPCGRVPGAPFLKVPCVCGSGQDLCLARRPRCT